MTITTDISKPTTVGQHPDPSQPRVNLLPENITRSLRVRSVLRRGAVGAGAIILGLAGFWWLESGAISAASDRVDQLQAQNDGLTQRITQLAPVGALSAQLNRQRDIVDASLASSPQAVEVINRLRAAAADSGGIRFTALNTTYLGLPQPGQDLNRCPNPDPFATTITIGCASFTAEATDRASVSRFIALLEVDSFFTGPYVGSTSLTSSTGDGGPRVLFTGTAGISIDALVTAPDQEYLATLTTPANDTGEVAP